MADKKITELTEDTAPSMTDLVPTVKDPGGTPLSRKVQITNLLALMQGNIINLVNNDGVSHYAGTVVIVDTTIDNGCKKTTSAGDPKVIGIAAETVAASATGKYYQIGQASVLVQGNVARGAWLIASATSGRAAQYGYLETVLGWHRNRADGVRWRRGGERDRANQHPAQLDRTASAAGDDIDK